MENNKTKLPRDVYTVGEIYEFSVKGVYSKYCELIDEDSGITTYLQGTSKLKIFKGQTVRCRVTAVSMKHPKIELIDISNFEQSTANLTEEKLTEMLAGQGVTWDSNEFVKLLLTDEKDVPIESQCHKWINHLNEQGTDIDIVRNDCSRLLELSDLLNSCGETEREYYQNRLTLIIEQLSYYIKAAQLIANDTVEGAADTADNFIDNLFKKLEVSGFIYHPNKNFNILSSLFLLRPELINDRMKTLLDIIRSRDIKIWQKEPFKSALIKMLELYIRECDSKIDKTKDNQTLINNNMLALAVQLLLLKGSKDTFTVDRRLNTARLCTISSYIQTLNPERLVDVGYYCLFDSEGKNINYSLDKINLVPHFIANSYSTNQAIDTINSYTKDDAKLIVSAEGVQLRHSRTEGDPYLVFPNSLGLWKGMQVYLNSKPETNLTKVKPNDILPYQRVWSEIYNEYINAKPVRTKPTTQNKKRHKVGETVDISIVRQDTYDTNRFECCIEDEIGGTGYILTKDIVSYTIVASVQNFIADNGNRLIFEAEIKENEDGEFHFSMLSLVKDKVSGFYGYDEEIYATSAAVPTSIKPRRHCRKRD